MLLDVVLASNKLLPKGSADAAKYYRGKRSRGTMQELFDSLQIAAKLFDKACFSARMKYSMEEDVKGMKHLLGLR